jgi:hypothetical protein
VVFVGGYFYDPFFGPYPWWSPAAYPYPYYPAYDDRASLRLLVKPKEASVYVDGYYAGTVDDFDGIFQRLPLPPGAHDIVLHLEGYRTVHQSLYLAPGSTYKLRDTMQRLAAGESSEPPPSMPAVPPPAPGSAMPPLTPPRGGPAALPPPRTPPARASQAEGYGSLAIQVQPADAEVTIDGERWNSSEGADRLIIQLAPGPHRVEVQKSGYRRFATGVQIRAGDTTPLNVSLSPERRQ